MPGHILPASEARSEFFTLLDKIIRLREKYTITKDGHPGAVLMSAEEFDEWVETLQILSRPLAVKGIRKGLKELKAKKLVSHEKVFGHPLNARS
ncbi:MAG: type II toxin-antitoxin system Phd/YefM family antitoxin [Deltaproteobacteria bacterium]|nr:type II toxin-antitoxin system Phd/YefM family antitoxin [Deltaproteobacteria bacterium]MBI4373353.1 type II toxin-antitoxin system Phd/YefM family antitoxin [Deltaproteobacteria bacterium]